jgi:hypothetical protein
MCASCTGPEHKLVMLHPNLVADHVSKSHATRNHFLVRRR